MQAGRNALVYTAKRRRLFLFRPARRDADSGVGRNCARELRERGKLAPERVKQVRCGVAGLEQPEALAFMTPAGARVDGDLSEWAGTDPIVLATREDFVPLSEEAKWGGRCARSPRKFIRDGTRMA